MRESKKYFFFLFFLATFMISGCRKKSGILINGDPHLTISAVNNGRGVFLSWDEVTSNDGFLIVTPANDSTQLGYDETTFTDSTPSSTGTYSLFTISSDTISGLATVSSAPFMSTHNATIYSWNSTTPSGYGWNYITGLGTFYLCVNENWDVIDFYLNDETAILDFSSCDEPPYSGDKTTLIHNMGMGDFFLAPDSGFSRSCPVSLGNYYTLKVQSNHYVKVHVVSLEDSTGATFSYQFQTIKGLRIF
jgi:hypothetical protein